MAPLSLRCFQPLPLAARDEEARLLLRGMRLWVLLARACRSPRPPLEALLGPAASALCQLMEATTAAWPDPFVTYPPCATAVAPDEDVLLALVGDALAADRPAFEARIADLVAGPARARLWTAAGRLVAERAGLA